MKFLDLLKSKDQSFKRNLWFFLGSYFLTLVNYPLIRASSTSLFFSAFGAKSSPEAWAWAVLFLSITIFCCNMLQKIFTVQWVFALISIFSGLLFLCGELAFFSGSNFFAYASFVWKEIYIVLQIHLILGYANNYFEEQDFKVFLGPIGAIGSLGGVLGGLLTSFLSAAYGTTFVMSVGVVLVIIPFIFFSFTQKLNIKNNHKKSPLSSLDTPDVRKYVFYIALMVTLTQFIINIADFQFNVAFEQSVTDPDQRTSYLGHTYTLTNILTFSFQFLLLPLLLPRIAQRSLHLFIPSAYLLGVFIMMLGSGFLPVAGVYVFFKASDYSFFSAGKELLYRPLEGMQKYGAKYLTDMLVYRTSKAAIALILISLQTSTILNAMMLGFIIIWLIVVIKLFRLQLKLFS